MLFQLGICNVIFLYTFICYYYIKVILDLKHILHWKQPFQIWQNLLQITLWVLIKVNLSQKKHFVHQKKIHCSEISSITMLLVRFHFIFAIEKNSASFPHRQISRKIHCFLETMHAFAQQMCCGNNKFHRSDRTCAL